MTRIQTIGFTRKTAGQFFGMLRESGARRLLDVRLNNRSQLAGFAKRDDLSWFLGELCEMEYTHIPLLAPESEMLDDYKKRGGAWEEYERRFLDLLSARRVERELSRELLDDACLLCSEHEPHFCHRRLVAEYLSKCWGEVSVRHLIAPPKAAQ